MTPTTSQSPSLLLLTGDQVYVDATAGLFDPRSQNDRLRLPYQNLMGSRGAQAVFGLLPVAMLLDDHELVDNWEGVAAGDAVSSGIAERRRERRRAADSNILEGQRAYRRFQRMAGPPLRDREALWCEFTHSGVPFFLADTRTERGVRGTDTECGTLDWAPRRVDNWRRAHIMDRRQWGALRTFLLKHRDQVSFVVSPSMLLPRGLGLGRDPSLALERDGWDGFPASMHELLALLCDHELNRVVFLSGDAHTSLVAQATVTSGGHRAALWSVHSSGLYCPFPFVNDSADDYSGRETFCFEQPGPPPRGYRCTVEVVESAPGDGFATLILTGSDQGRRGLQVRFHRAGGDVVRHIRI